MFEEIPNASNRSRAMLPEPGFHLFGKLNGDLAGQKSNSRGQLLLATREAIHSIGGAELESVFDAWKRRLSECIQMKCEHTSQGKSKSLGEKPLYHPQPEMPKNHRTPYASMSIGDFLNVHSGWPCAIIPHKSTADPPYCHNNPILIYSVTGKINGTGKQIQDFAQSLDLSCPAL
jgi:hypothetical protein